MAKSLTTFPFRPWVRRAGASIVLVALAATAIIVAFLLLDPRARYGWLGQTFVWVYIAALWLGGLKVWLGAMRPIAEAGNDTLTLRPLHQFGRRVMRWDTVRGTEQMLGGDRLIVYYDTPRGMRFVALNLNLVKGRRDFLTLLDEKLLQQGFVEKVVDRSRYLSRAS